MNRKSALFVAAGMVLTLVVAAAAMTMGVAGPSRADASVARPGQRKPIVKTTVDTVTVHKQGQATGAPVSTTVVRTLAPATAPTTAGTDDGNDTDRAGDGVAEPGDATDVPTVQPSQPESEDVSTESPEPQETESHSESPEPSVSSGDDD